MSGYTGRPDDESEHALILAENAIHAARVASAGPVVEDCIDCGLSIGEERRKTLSVAGMRCVRCFSCQSLLEKKPKSRIRMLDRIL